MQEMVGEQLRTSTSIVLERAQRIRKSQDNLSQHRMSIRRFLNCKDKQALLQAACVKQGNYEDQQEQFYQDLAAGILQKRKTLETACEELRKLGFCHVMTHTANLLVAYEGEKTCLEDAKGGSH